MTKKSVKCEWCQNTEFGCPYCSCRMGYIPKNNYYYVGRRIRIQCENCGNTSQTTITSSTGTGVNTICQCCKRDKKINEMLKAQ